MKVLRHLASYSLPITILIVIPWLIEKDFRLSGIGRTISGSLFICFGLLLMILTIQLFYRIGKGTLAPWDPTRKLVTSSLYRYVRNPMIQGVLFVLIGEAMFFASSNIGIEALLFFVINTVYFILFEEPGLVRRFGDEYIEYKKHVPRWIPRTKPWKPDEKQVE